MTETKTTGSAIAEQTNSMLPAHLQGGKKASMGNIDQNDLIIPRVKLLQATSPEVEAFVERGAKIGQFWHTLSESVLGNVVPVIPIVLKKELVLWAPRGDDRGILARSSDCINWDAGFQNLEFEVKVKGVAKPVKYRTMGNVAESGLAEFGSLIPDDPKSRPAASLTYRFMFYFPNTDDVAIVINTRGSVKPAKMLISKIESKPVDHYGQLYDMGTTDEKSDEGPYKGYSYTSAGYADEKQYARAMSFYERFKDVEWKANEEADDVPARDGASGGEATSNKF